MRRRLFCGGGRSSPVGGADGAAAANGGLAAVLAVELVLMQRLNRRDGVPLATAAQLLRAVVRGGGPVDFGWRQPVVAVRPTGFSLQQPSRAQGVVLVRPDVQPGGRTG